MCRGITEESLHFPERGHLKIKSFHLRLSVTGSHRLPEALTLLYLPPLEKNDAIRTGVPQFVALDRNRTSEPATGAEAVYSSFQFTSAGHGLRYEVYVGAERALKGGFRCSRSGSWAMDCRSVAETSIGVSAAEVCVVGERGVVMRERVRMRRRSFCLKLEEIPEEGEEEMDGCDCSECDEDVGSDGEESGDEEGEVGEIEGVRASPMQKSVSGIVGVGYGRHQSDVYDNRRPFQKLHPMQPSVSEVNMTYVATSTVEN